ncbi:MAG TPA: hypothetical protein VMD55_12570, partial [Terracidiphilus sp.]|nr:hypothetical protein [Terracidiphilus sp.]
MSTRKGNDNESVALLKEIPSPVRPSSALEWDKFAGLLGSGAQSTLGRRWIEALRPSTDRAWMERQHRLVEEMRSLAAAGGMPQLRALFDPSEMLAKARIEGVALEA